MVKIKVTDFYDEFRPYNEKEAKEALGRLAQNERFFKILNYFFNDLTKKSFFELLNSINSIHDFQEKIMAEVGKIILKKRQRGSPYQVLKI
jgi:glutamyl-tRNA reductase